MSSACVTFVRDHVPSAIFFNDVLTPEECKRVIEYGTSLDMVAGKTAKQRALAIRKSRISWIYPTPESEWFYSRLCGAIIQANVESFRFKLFGMIEGMQFTEYVAPDGHYGKHIDKRINEDVRKLSLVLQLTDPSEYEGGDLLLHLGNEPDTAPRAQGSVTIFPSYVLHEVTPVTSGTRHSLVAWVTGEPFT
jgi:PKHD-type hydroxylase